ncbi:MAG: hypothetical protein WAN65_30190 [Candidatus Sulfotelmatobacter sp.]
MTQDHVVTAASAVQAWAKPRVEVDRLLRRKTCKQPAVSNDCPCAGTVSLFTGTVLQCCGNLNLFGLRIAELLPPTRDAARRLGLVTLEQMTTALLGAVENPASGTKAMEVPAIRSTTALKPLLGTAFGVSFRR